MSERQVIGSVLVVGGGIAGMPSGPRPRRFRLSRAPGGESSAIGGVMSELDKTFPTNDCAM